MRQKSLVQCSIHAFRGLSEEWIREKDANPKGDAARDYIKTLKLRGEEGESEVKLVCKYTKMGK